MPTTVDTSMYAPSAQQNPFGVLHNFAATQALMNQNMMFGLQLQARTRMGQIMQQSIGPDGTPDYKKAGSLMSMDPLTVPFAADYINTMTQRDLTQRQSIHQELENNKILLDAAGGAAGALVTKWHQGYTDPSTGQMVKDQGNMGDLVHSVAGLRASFPEHEQYWDNFLIQNAGQDPRAMYDNLVKLTQQAQITSRGIEGVQANIKVPGVVQSGQQTGAPTVSYGTMSKLTGQVTPGEVEGQQGAPPAASPAAQPPGTPPLAPGELPVYPTQQAADAAGAQPASSAGPPPVSPPAVAPGTFVTGLGDIQKAKLKSVSDYITNLPKRQNDMNATMGNLAQVESLTNQIQTGGGAELYKQLASNLQALGADPKLVDMVNGGSLGATQAWEKDVFNLGLNRIADIIHASGGRMTQAEIFAFLTRGNPNLDMDPRAIQTIFNQMKEVKGWLNYEQAAFSKFQANPHNDPYRWQTEYWPHLFDKILASQHPARRPDLGQ